MATDTLVNERIDQGLALIEELRKRSFPFTAVFWAKTSEDEAWNLYIATPLYDKEGPLRAYQDLFAIVRNVPSAFSLQFEIKVIGSSNPAAKEVEKIQSHAFLQGRQRFRSLGNMVIEEAYIYAL
jgi:hypothetical protein